jgi:hypothetical protein
MWFPLSQKKKMMEEEYCSMEKSKEKGRKNVC